MRALRSTHEGEGSPNDEVERRGVAPTPNEADLSRSSTHPWSIEDAARDRSNRLLGVTAGRANCALPEDDVSGRKDRDND